MTIYELHRRYELILDKASSGAYPDIPIEQRNEFLNLGLEAFIKQRYSGLNAMKASFEETQKRRDDLSFLTVSTPLQALQTGYATGRGTASMLYALPTDYWITVAELVRIKPVGCSSYFLQPVFMGRHNQLGVLLEDPFNRPRRENCFSIQESFGGNQVKHLFYDTTSTIDSYIINYIRQYSKLSAFDLRAQAILQANASYTLNPLPTYHTLPDPSPITIVMGGQTLTLESWKTKEFSSSLQSHQEIVDLAVKKTLEVIESPRYQTFEREQVTSE